VATGYWFLDRSPDWRPPAALVDFLDGGEPPVYVGFGSIPTGDPAAKARVVLEALAGRRAVLASGWGGLVATDLPANVLQIDQAPHDWLFPRMRAVVHHGGAGTTAAGLRAGKPAVVCPFFGDQPFWGERLRALGVAPAPVPQHRLDAGKLGAAIRRAVDDDALQARAAELADAIRSEDGVATAVAILEELGRDRVAAR
jgi:sterol 3beta-glucosyltransferase